MPSCESEVLDIARKLEKMASGSKPIDGALDMLERLGKLDVTIDILQSTQVGRVVNELRKKTSDERFAKKAKQLIKEWKSLISTEAGGDDKPSAPAKRPPTVKEPARDSRAGSNSRSSADDNNGSAQAAPKVSAPAPPPAPSSSSSLAMAASGGEPFRHLGSDEVRYKCAQMILSALRSGELPDGTLDPDQLAANIERKLYEVHHSTGDKYKAALRSRVFNLRDKKNLALRENVLTGVIKAEKFAVMTSDEMASDDVKRMREQFTKEAIEEYQMAVQQGNPSDLFKCGKCGQKNCTYTQLQTRSSDEPMTTFVFCTDCGNRWKFC